MTTIYIYTDHTYISHVLLIAHGDDTFSSMTPLMYEIPLEAPACLSVHKGNFTMPGNINIHD
jgi:hypothetical protein